MPSPPLERRPAAAGPEIQVGPFSLVALGPQARFALRLRDGARGVANEALGVPLPTQSCRSAGRDGVAALWLGPDEWLICAPHEVAAGIERRLSEGLREAPHALVDVSGAYAAFLASGPKAATVLNGACPLDLHPSAFPVGACTRTLMGKASVVLWRTADAAFRVEVARSYAPYAAALLRECAHGAP